MKLALNIDSFPGAPPFTFRSLWERPVINHLNGKSYTLPMFNLMTPYGINFHLAWREWFISSYLEQCAMWMRTGKKITRNSIAAFGSTEGRYLPQLTFTLSLSSWILCCVPILVVRNFDYFSKLRITEPTFSLYSAFPPLIPEAIKTDLNLTTAQIGMSDKKFRSTQMLNFPRLCG